MSTRRLTKSRALLLLLCVNFAIGLSYNRVFATEVYESGPIFAGGETIPPTGPFAIAITFRTVDPSNGDTSFYCLFNGLVLNDADVGRTFYADETSDPVFADVVRVLTNGRLDEVGASNGDPASLGPCPSLGRGSAGPENVVFCVETDFAGVTIERIGLRVEEMVLPGFPGRHFQGTLLIEGTGTPVLCPTEVLVDIKPNSSPNSINLGSNGAVPVAILSSSNFDATTVDPLTVTLAGAHIRLTGKGTPITSKTDVNGDGRVDLIIHVNTEALTLTTNDTQATLTGQTFSGTRIKGSDSVRVVP